MPCIKCSVIKNHFFIFIFCRRNPRNYTGIINNGVTRSENLTGMMSFADQFGWDISNMPLSDALVEEVQRMANERNDLSGLEECFKKVCKVRMIENKLMFGLELSIVIVNIFLVIPCLWSVQQDFLDYELNQYFPISSQVTNTEPK